MTTIRVRIAAAVTALATAVIVAGCSSSSGEGHKGGHGAANSTTAAGAGSDSAQGDAKDHNAQDVTFTQGMIPHHQQAVEIATLAQTSDNAELRKLANTIIDGQASEITAFQNMLLQWGVPEQPDHSAHNGMQGMIDQPTIDRLKTLKGADFDRLWLQSMITHHEGAIAMADEEIAKGKSPDTIQVAKVILATQKAEIEQMNTLLKNLG